MSEGTRLSTADAAWLGVGRPENLMVITAVLRFGGGIGPDTLRELVRARLLQRYPTFSMRVVSTSRVLPPVWRPDPELDLDRHVVPLPLPGPLDDAALQRVVGDLMGRPLDLAHPPWQLHLVTGGDGNGFAVVARLHHCLADGIALAAVLLSLLDDASDQASDGVAAPGSAPLGRRPRGARSPGAIRLAAGVARTAVQVLLFTAEPRTRLRGRLGTVKRVAWTAPQDLADVKAVARARRATVNDVLLAATAGGLRRYLLGHGETAVDLRALVPVDLRPRGADVPPTLGNRFGMVFVRLPVSCPDPLGRLATLSSGMRALRGSAQGPATFVLLSLVGALPAFARRLAVDVLGAASSAVVTNVPGPRQGLTLAGRPLDTVVFWVPQVGSIGLGVSIFSYAGAVTVGVATDAGPVPDPAAMTAAIEAELADLVRLAVRPTPG